MASHSTPRSSSRSRTLAPLCLDPASPHCHKVRLPVAEGEAAAPPRGQRGRQLFRQPASRCSLHAAVAPVARSPRGFRRGRRRRNHRPQMPLTSTPSPSTTPLVVALAIPEHNAAKFDFLALKIHGISPSSMFNLFFFHLVVRSSWLCSIFCSAGQLHQLIAALF